MARTKTVHRTATRRSQRFIQLTNIKENSQSKPEVLDSKPKLQQLMKQVQNQQLQQLQRSQLSQYYCQQCDKLYANLSSFNAHNKKHDGRRWACEQCDRCFVSKYAYQRHIARSHQRQHVTQRTEQAENADEVEVYVSDGETAHLTHKAKDKIIKRLEKKLDRNTEIIKRMRENSTKLKKEKGDESIEVPNDSSEDSSDDSTSEETSTKSSED